ncbi:MAG: hypothetical protein A2X61_05340 [Ignavibacteria bacterium GWB2_35_12]|nr:MAG: hypothetical protein A2X63_09405 [Ignavibacteria bacterium GWA2_35_8]OGU42150.1 MAG: hypothetical protein A2X61_05340 [Ignavibacteria bacterium GWB2_35_12]OGV19867.1 MAG: hypothetical protein A2475_01965 [Ignavibacteria bacterium RIFOXYC2_FULL_35_21]
MEILIAILWYLQLLIPGITYTQSDINNLIQENNKAIHSVKKDVQQTTQIMNDYNNKTNNQWKKIIEEWEDPPPDPILD